MAEIRFNDLLPLVDKYSSIYDDELSDDYSLFLLAEVKKRIRQIWRLYRIIEDHLNQIKNIVPELTSDNSSEVTDPPDHVMRFMDLTDSLEMFTEAIYLIAWRLICIVRLLPGLNEFEAKGVAKVRNRIIQHPSKEQRKGFWGFSLPAKEGPTLMRLVAEGKAPFDKGLWVNLTELINQIRTSFTNAIIKDLDA